MERRQERTARGIFTLGSFVLLCQGKDEPYWCMPGGHCEVGEIPYDTLRREMWEETGREVATQDLLTVMQNDFDKSGVHIEEEMWLYRGTLSPILKEDPPHTREAHLRFAWAPVAEIELWNVMPPAIVPYIRFVGGG